MICYNCDVEENHYQKYIYAYVSFVKHSIFMLQRICIEHMRERDIKRSVRIGIE